MLIRWLFGLPEPLGLHREMHLVLEARIFALGDQAGILGDDLAQRLDPGPLRFGEVAEHIGLHQLLDAGVTDPDAYPFVLIADMGGDRAQPVMAGNAAPDRKS